MKDWKMQDMENGRMEYVHLENGKKSFHEKDRKSTANK